MKNYILTTRNIDTDKASFGNIHSSASYLAVQDSKLKPAPSDVRPNFQTWATEIITDLKKKAGRNPVSLDVVFYVHGYNTSSEEALKRQRLIEKRLIQSGFTSTVIGFDWPSADIAVMYETDRLEAMRTAAELVTAGIAEFVKYSRPDCTVNLHIVAHSMGAYVVREAFRQADKARVSNQGTQWKVSQIALLAADISSDCFESGHADMDSVFQHCSRLTNYYSGHDTVLGVSNVKNLDISSRVGRVGMPTNVDTNPKAVDVDCTNRYNALSEDQRKTSMAKCMDGSVTHSWYFDDDVWYQDLAMTLAGRIDRNYFPTRERMASNDFALKQQTA